MPAELSKRTEQVVEAFREQLGPLASEAVGEKGFADLAVIVQEALQRERAEVAGQFEAMARALRATAETTDIGL
jgi:hypothetical protein